MKPMPAIACLYAASACFQAHAIGTFTAQLTPTQPTNGNTWFPAKAAFSLDGPALDFSIRFGVESVIPTTARIVGADTHQVFDLGTAFIVIHSPGPWPDGYDGATFFEGSFELAEALRTDLQGGLATLQLLGANAGDFTGLILPLGGGTDADGDIDDTDIGAMVANYTGPVGALGGKSFGQGDTDRDGDVDDTDLGTGFVGYTGPTSPGVVPEPASLVLMSLGGLLVTRRRRGVAG